MIPARAPATCGDKSWVKMLANEWVLSRISATSTTSKYLINTEQIHVLGHGKTRYKEGSKNYRANNFHNYSTISVSV